MSERIFLSRKTRSNAEVNTHDVYGVDKQVYDDLIESGLSPEEALDEIRSSSMYEVTFESHAMEASDIIETHEESVSVVDVKPEPHPVKMEKADDHCQLLIMLALNHLHQSVSNGDEIYSNLDDYPDFNVDLDEVSDLIEKINFDGIAPAVEGEKDTPKQAVTMTL